MVVEAENEAKAYDLADEASDDEEVWADVFNAGDVSLSVFEADEHDLETYQESLRS